MHTALCSEPRQLPVSFISEKRMPVFALFDLNDFSSPIEIKHLGRTSPSSTVQYFDKKMVFVGSKEDNSCVLRILDKGKLLQNRK